MNKSEILLQSTALCAHFSLTFPRLISPLRHCFLETSVDKKGLRNGAAFFPFFAIDTLTTDLLCVIITLQTAKGL